MHVAVVNYYATGEGVTVGISIHPSAEKAVKKLGERMPEYFMQGMEVYALEDLPDMLWGLLPPSIGYQVIPNLELVLTYHYNLS